MSKSPIETLRDTRLEKLDALRELGIAPYPSRSGRTHYAGDIVEKFDAMEDERVTVAGRLVSWRPHGSLTFGHIQDQSGQIQLLLQKKALPETDGDTGALGYDHLKLLDMGDFVEAAGTVTKTRRGEVSVNTDRLHLLAKSLRPLPEKWHGLKDREIILRRRYLHAVGEPAERARFETVSRMIYSMRTFLDAKGFLEFQTPVLQPQYGGGTAKPFTTHVNALHCRMYLSISHELYLKRLIAAGFDKVFTIGRYFRNEGIDRSHHPEFSMLETMTAYENYEYNMDLTEDLLRHVAGEVFGKHVFKVGEHEMDFAKPWQRISMADAVRQATGVDFRAVTTADEAEEQLRSLGVEQPADGPGKAMVLAFEELVAPTLIGPAFVYGHPMEISPLAKPMDDDPRFAERFEIFMGGMECGDNWSEQNDPVALLDAWRRLQETADQDDETHPLDYDFLEVLEHGMPPTTGLGPGIERLAMIFTESENMDDVIFFPMMKPTLSPANAAIFGVDELPSDRQHAGEDVVLTIEEFQTLLADGAMRPQAEHVIIRPYLRVWTCGSDGGPWTASGHLEVEGFFLDARLLLSGYRVCLEQPPADGQDTRGFVDVIGAEVVKPIRKHIPKCRLTVEDVIELTGA